MDMNPISTSGWSAAWLGVFLAGPVLSADVAHIGKQTISRQELETRAADKLAEQQKAYDQSLLQLRLKLQRQQHGVLEQVLAKLVDERVLALEAASQKTTPEALLAKVQPAPVTDADVRAFFDANQAQIRQPFDAIQPRLRDYLQEQARDTANSAYLSSLRLKHHAVTDLQPLRETVAASGPQRGPADAKITIIEFSDFQCPFCGRYSPAIKQVMDKHPKDVRLVFRHRPLPGLHPNAQKAAEAAVCAQDQGKFWEMHDLLFAEQASLGVDALKEKARRIGLDAAVFDECLTSGRSETAVGTDVRAAEQLGIAGTPASFVNGRFVEGAVTADDLEALIDDELHRPAAEH